MVVYWTQKQTPNNQKKKKTLEIVCSIMARNSGDPLEDESIETTIKLYSAQ